MAHAARLNLRLQKELKLLLTDPPPGAAFPLLSSSSSLSAIDAQIKGPEGTVYADGLFNLKIQIPDRYPFQPPSVTFSTPIYHPNIDTGGRICLDILNLPPKGAWQPSLNISTVLTSIGLLLSEPNPDDGLMCEASREFKYNRQAFDQKARSMTQKYAQTAATGSACETLFESHANPIRLEVETTDHESKHEASESVVSYKKVISKKLSLECSSQSEKRNASLEGNDVPKGQVVISDFGNQMEAEKAVKDTLEECSLSQEKICGSRRKLSLSLVSHGKFQKKSDKEMEVGSSKKVISRKLSLECSGQTEKRDAYREGKQVLKGQLVVTDLGNRIEVEGTDSAVKDTLDRCDESQDKICGNRRKLSLESHNQFQNKTDKDTENVVPNLCPALRLQNLPMPSSGSLVLQSGNRYKQGVHQSQDIKLRDDNIGMGSKRACQFGNKQSSGSLNTSQMIDKSNDETLGKSQVLSSQSHSNVLTEHLPVAAPAADSVNCRPHKEVIEETGNVSTGTSRKRLCLAGKKLSLGFRGSSDKPGNDGKENVAPQVSEHNNGGSRSAGANAGHAKYAMLQLQDCNSNTNIMLPQSNIVSSHPSKPMQHQNLGWDKKQQSDQDNNCYFTGAIKQKEAKESTMPDSEAVIVLDSESSDEERSKPPIYKSLLARKRLGKRIIRT